MIYGVIYLLFNTINGKMYIGQTKQAFKRRIAEHKRDSKKRKVGVDAAIHKYGWENFRYGVIKKCASKAEMDTWEKFFIILLNTKSPNGYNLTDGGEGVSGFTDETRAILSAKRKGVKKSPEHCLNIAVSLRGTTPYKNLLNEIEKRHLKYFEVAELLGLSSSNFRNKISGRCHFTNKDIDKLVEFFGLPAEYLMARDDGLSSTALKAESFAKISADKRGDSPYKNLLVEIDKCHLTYRGLSKLTGISKSALPLKISGKVKFTADEIAKLVELFELPADYLMARDDGLATALSNYHKTQYKSLLNEINSRKLSYTAVAKLLGLSRTNFSNKMLGKYNFTAKDKVKLVEIFNKPMEYLLYKEEF